MLDLVAGPPWIVEGIANEAGHHVVAAPAAAYPPWPQGHQRGAVTEIPQRNRSHWRREPREEVRAARGGRFHHRHALKSAIPQQQGLRANLAQQATAGASLVDITWPHPRVADGMRPTFDQ